MYFVCRAVSTYSVVAFDGKVHDLYDKVLLAGRWYLCSEDYKKVYKIMGWVRTGWVGRASDGDSVILDLQNRSFGYHIVLTTPGKIGMSTQFHVPCVQGLSGDIALCPRLPGNMSLCSQVTVMPESILAQDQLPVWQRHTPKIDVDRRVHEMLTVAMSPYDGKLCYCSPKGLMDVDYLWCRQGQLYVVTVNQEGQIIDTPLRCKGDWMYLEQDSRTFLSVPLCCTEVQVPVELMQCDVLPILMDMPDGGLLPYRTETHKEVVDFKKCLSADALQCDDTVIDVYKKLEEVLPAEMVDVNMVTTLMNAAQLLIDGM